MSAVKSYPAAPTPFAGEQLTISTVALGGTAAVYAPAAQHQADEAYVTVEGQPIRWRTDGTDPTAAIGNLATAGTNFTVRGAAAVAKLRMIRQGGVDATVFITYSRFVR